LALLGRRGFLLLAPRLSLKRQDGYTPIHVCAEAGHEDIARLLIFEYLVSVERRTIHGRTPQNVAARAGHHNVAEFIRTQR